MTQPRASKLLGRFYAAKPGLRMLDYGCGDESARSHFEDLGFEYTAWDISGVFEQPKQASLVNLSYVLNVIDDVGERREVVRRAWALAEDSLLITVPPGFRADVAGKRCKRPLADLQDDLVSKPEWSDLNQAWLKEALGTKNVYQLSGDVYLATRAGSDFPQSVARGNMVQPFAAARRRDVLGWLPKALVALGMLGISGPAYASDIASMVKLIIIQRLGVAERDVTREASFTNDLGADSLDTVELIMDCETEFNITIPHYQADQLQTVGQLIQYIEQNVPR